MSSKEEAMVVGSVPQTDRFENGSTEKGDSPPFFVPLEKGDSPLFLEAAGEHGPEVIAQFEPLMDGGAGKVVAVLGQILPELL